MKKLFYLLSIVLLTMFASCSNEFDDSKLQDRLNRLEEEQKQLEEEHKQMQEQIDAQQTLLDALTKNLTIVSIVETDEGYVVTFSDNSTMIVGQGNSYIENIEVGEEAIIFTLADGTEVVLPLNSGGNSGGEVVGENNKIYYTTTDGKKLFPYNSGGAAFGAILISNTYIDGQGVLTFDDSVTTIGWNAFDGCSSLTSVTIPDSVTEIGYDAFGYCISLTKFNGKYASEDGRCLIIGGTLNSFAPAGLTEYTIPDSVTTIGYGAFAYCSSLTSVTIPDGVTTIGEGAFYGCSSLTNITIPDSVTTIGDGAFFGCISLTSVYCKAITPPAGGNYMFSYDGGGYIKPLGCTIYVPVGSVSAYQRAEYWSEYAYDIVGYNF